MSKFRKINVPFGGIKQLADELKMSRNTVSLYLSGRFDEWFQNLGEAKRVREYARKRFAV